MKIPFLLAALLASPIVHAQHKHVHGEGRLDVAIDKGTISISLEMPLDAALGFERAPKNDKEKAALAATAKTLNDAATLFVPTPTAGCTVHAVDVKVPFTGGADNHDHAHEGEIHHADIDAEYMFRCADPTALKDIETSIFKSFKRLYRLEVQRAGPTGQGAVRLTPKKPILNW
ncbi:MAG: DUF2796 domain-containing protein [Gammaproteobacteria bacterium]|nr:DUF2796 domain-containing protein [Gammaproteobacteria bacterium]MBU1414415.1 DUF2796 domain-containing protein [Gammaproteobacteria bacterium]